MLNTLLNNLYVWPVCMGSRAPSLSLDKEGARRLPKRWQSHRLLCINTTDFSVPAVYPHQLYKKLVRVKYTLQTKTTCNLPII